MEDQTRPAVQNTPQAPGTRRRTVFLDMTDLVEYLKHNTTVSGIQRVVANLILHAPEAAQINDVDVVLVFPDYARRKIYAVSRADVLAMMVAMEASHGDRTALDRAIADIYKNRKLVFPAAGDVFTIAGAFWTYDDYDLLTGLRRAGVGVVNFIHDLIQISNPEFVFEAATRQFRRALVDILSSSTGLLTNSEYVAEDVRRFIAARTDVDVPVRAVPLATELVPRKNVEQDLGAEVVALLGTPYVLSVSTIEVRKNHAFMVRVWKALIDLGVPNLPDLVFVGKIGWDIGPFIDYLEETNYLDGKVRILNSISDDELAELYRHAQVTMYMSFVEGFGLPVAESLAYGVPCISSSRSSMPEVGGRFARYIDPEDIDGGIELVRTLIEQPAELAAWRKDVQENFRMRTWREFSLEYISSALAIPIADWHSCNNIFRAGEIYGMGRWEVARRDAHGDKLAYLVNARLDGWHANEDWGCWSSARRATLSLSTELAEGTAVVVYCMVQAPGHQAIRLSIAAGESETDIGAVTSEPVWKAIDCVVGREGMITLTFEVVGECPKASDPRQLWAGVLGVAFCERADMAGRLKLVEALALDPRRMGAPPEVARPTFKVSLGITDEEVDSSWYLEYYSDVKLVGMAAEDHYRWIGKRLGRYPSLSALQQAS